MISKAVIENLTKKEMVFQKGQCLATLTKMEDIYVNKKFPNYTCFISIGLNFDKLFNNKNNNFNFINYNKFKNLFVIEDFFLII